MEIEEVDKKFAETLKYIDTQMTKQLTAGIIIGAGVSIIAYSVGRGIGGWWSDRRERKLKEKLAIAEIADQN